MNIKTASEQTGVSSAAIRYYEKESLIPPIDRSAAGNREIDERIIRRITFVKQMRDAGMSIENLRHYIELFDSPADTDQEQQVLLREQLTEMEAKRDDLQAAIDHLHYKLEHYYDHMVTTEQELTKLDAAHAAKLTETPED